MFSTPSKSKSPQKNYTPDKYSSSNDFRRSRLDWNNVPQPSSSKKLLRPRETASTKAPSTNLEGSPSRIFPKSAEKTERIRRQDIIIYLKHLNTKIDDYIAGLESIEKVCENYEKGDIHSNHKALQEYTGHRENFAHVSLASLDYCEKSIGQLREKLQELGISKGHGKLSGLQGFNMEKLKLVNKAADRRFYHSRFNEKESVLSVSYSVADPMKDGGYTYQANQAETFLISCHDLESSAIVYKTTSNSSDLKQCCPYYLEPNAFYDSALKDGDFVGKIELQEAKYTLQVLFEFNVTNSITCFEQLSYGPDKYLAVGTTIGTFFFLKDKYMFDIPFKGPIKLIHIEGTNMLAILQPGGRVTVYNLKTKDTLYQEVQHADINAFEYDPVMKWLLIGNNQGKLMILEVRQTGVNPVKALYDLGDVLGVAVADEDTIAVVEKNAVAFISLLDGSGVGTKHLDLDKYEPVQKVYWAKKLRTLIMLTDYRWMELKF